MRCAFSAGHKFLVVPWVGIRLYQRSVLIPK